MAYTASKLIEIATAEIGYHEKASNANLDSKMANIPSKLSEFENDVGYLTLDILPQT